MLCRYAECRGAKFLPLCPIYLNYPYRSNDLPGEQTNSKFYSFLCRYGTGRNYISSLRVEGSGQWAEGGRETGGCMINHRYL
jgi:hypothetical protein